MENKIHYVYLTTNLVNGKQYVGDHTINGRYYLGSGSILNSAIKKYGKDNFFKEILEWFDTRKEASLAQEKYIKQFNTLAPNGYNINPNGGIPGTNTPESIEKMRQKLLGRKITWNEKISNALKNYEKTEEHCNNISKALKGKPSVLKGKKRKKEFGRNVSISRITKGTAKGKNNPMYGKTLMETWIIKYGIDEANIRMNNMKDRMSKARTEKKLAEEHCKHISESKIGKKQPTRICPHCNKEISCLNYTKWHGDKCKLKKNI
jgi:hypothetical protein